MRKKVQAKREAPEKLRILSMWVENGALWLELSNGVLRWFDWKKEKDPDGKPNAEAR